MKQSQPSPNWWKVSPVGLPSELNFHQIFADFGAGEDLQRGGKIGGIIGRKQGINVGQDQAADSCRSGHLEHRREATMTVFLGQIGAAVGIKTLVVSVM